jgi:hypothetical protein
MPLNPARIAWTGIGSLPQSTLPAALEHVALYYPRLPYLPQIAAGTALPSMLHEVLPERVRHAARGRGLDLPWTADDPAAAEAFTADREELAGTPYRVVLAGALAIARTLPAFTHAPAVKAQIMGPCSILASMRDAWFQPLWHAAGVRAAAADWIAALAGAAIGGIRDLGAQPLLWLDEPMLGHLETAGEALAAAATLDRTLAALRAAGARTGLHCCSTPPFAILRALALDDLSLDAVRYGPEILDHAPDVAALLARGVRLVLGVVPVTPDGGAFAPRAFVRRLRERLGSAGALLPSQLLISPSCGTLLAPEEREVELAAALAGFAAEIESELST